ncbi:hypothetical protein [Noviherbaspirillum pedocola]|uniref:Uncharacterized protein n=1 Tax=Noviherbaspirillum pedocola TaxID=2801341 RepID=A0A934W8W8_9BURK|nr:hypothetical protein [Noviherbaspirillum pedocola]MBK4737308.1 hypothetical protein [Noviherbaspirillum pedocola]
MQNAIETLVTSHPKIFKGKSPKVSPLVPVGWSKLLKILCKVLEEECTASTLAKLEIINITRRLRCFLKVEYKLKGKVSPQQAWTVRDKVFSVSHLCTYSCVVCGEYIGDSPKSISMILCEKHIHSALPASLKMFRRRVASA